MLFPPLPLLITHASFSFFFFFFFFFPLNEHYVTLTLSFHTQEQVLANLKGVLAAAGAGFENVVKTTVFLKDMNNFAAMNEVYAKVRREAKM